MGNKSMKKRTGRKTKSRRQKTMRKRLRSRGGGCDCNLTGGSANLESLPKEYYYEYNKNPSYLSDQIKGGKRNKKLKGGLGGIYSLGSVIDIQNVGQLLGVSQIQNESVTDQPAAKIFHENNLP
jgi:hypothetical protein